jgi:glycoprotein endo-alpha-1,2-mannosidase
MRRAALTLLAASVLAPAASAGSAGSGRVSIFYYPWYGVPAVDGDYQHWQQRNHRLPGQLASAFYPARGLYSSSDRAVVASQMREIARAGVHQVVSSWWGRGSLEDRRLPLVVELARAQGLDVAVHLEPYDGRTPATTAADIRHLEELGVEEFYLYGSHDAPLEAWAEVNRALDGARILVQTAHPGYAARGGFAGLYTYDILVWDGGKLARVCEQARRLQLVCAPSVGPGYDARRAVGDGRVKARRSGATYDAMWRAAIRSHAEIVSITSYNEWHEGTQIEPARPHRGPKGGDYLGYEGAWGRTGRAAERAYLDRTRDWAARFVVGRRVATAHVQRLASG